ncbi:signal peptidase I [Clostridium beijerinckii]|nr:signal peptidase I [Clostridium beijerinckii]
MREEDEIMESKDIDSLESSSDYSKSKDIIADKEGNLSKKGFVGIFTSKGGFFREWIIPIVAAIAIAFLINKFLVYNVYIPSESMVPTLNVGDKLMVTRVYDTDKIKRGDMIVFFSEELNEILIKRAIGLPGDHIKIHNGIVNINGEDIKEDYVKNNESFDGSFDVPDNKFFFLGDNRSRSNDARRWINPYIDASNIQGRARIKFYPFKDFGSLN